MLEHPALQALSCPAWLGGHSAGRTRVARQSYIAGFRRNDVTLIVRVAMSLSYSEESSLRIRPYYAKVDEFLARILIPIRRVSSGGTYCEQGKPRSLSICRQSESKPARSAAACTFAGSRCSQRNGARFGELPPRFISCREVVQQHCGCGVSGDTVGENLDGSVKIPRMVASTPA